MSKQSSEPLILLDSDVVRHFINGDRILDLPGIFPGRFVMLEIVKNELCKSKSLVNYIENLLKMTDIRLIEFPKQIDVIKEYAILKKQFGDGESACMAVAKFSKHYIASSNLKDIKSYCESNDIIYLTTMDILLEANRIEIMTDSDCDAFIQQVKAKGSKLPCNSINDFKQLKNKTR